MLEAGHHHRSRGPLNPPCDRPELPGGHSRTDQAVFDSRPAGDLVAIAQAIAVITLHPGAVSSYVRDVQRLEEINGDLAYDASAAAAVIRSMIVTVTIVPTPAGKPGITARGTLNRLLDPALFHDGVYLGGRLVAEDGFEPPTRGL